MPMLLAGAAACQHLADLAGAGLEPRQRDHLGYFAIRVGAGRLADAATWLTRIGATTAAEITDRQARSKPLKRRRPLPGREA
jgi:hypothetical protein